VNDAIIDALWAGYSFEELHAALGHELAMAIQLANSEVASTREFWRRKLNG